MLLFGLAAMIVGLGPNTLPGPPAFADGDSFHRLVQAAHSQCPSADVAHLTPAGLLDLDETFRESLTAASRARLDAALPRTSDDGLAACKSSVGGASCDALSYLGGFRRSGLWPTFVHYICRPGMVR
jgi:hypothetical protein